MLSVEMFEADSPVFSSRVSAESGRAPLKLGTATYVACRDGEVALKFHATTSLVNSMRPPSEPWVALTFQTLTLSPGSYVVGVGKYGWIQTPKPPPVELMSQTWTSSTNSRIIPVAPP